MSHHRLVLAHWTKPYIAFVGPLLGAGPCGDSSHGGRAAALQSLFWLSTAEQSALSLFYLPHISLVVTLRLSVTSLPFVELERRDIAVGKCGVLRVHSEMF